MTMIHEHHSHKQCFHNTSEFEEESLQVCWILRGASEKYKFAFKERHTELCLSF